MQWNETAFTLLSEAIAEKARCSVPLVGHATDRRALRQVGEVFSEASSEVLMCFVCACKLIAHKGYNKFGEKQEKGDICYRTNDTNDLLHRIVVGDKNTNYDN